MIECPACIRANSTPKAFTIDTIDNSNCKDLGNGNCEYKLYFTNVIFIEDKCSSSAPVPSIKPPKRTSSLKKPGNNSAKKAILAVGLIVAVLMFALLGFYLYCKLQLITNRLFNNLS